MQNACEEVVLSLGAAEIDNGSILEHVLEEANDALARVVVQRNHMVDAPAGRVKRKKVSELTIDISESSRVD